MKRLFKILAKVHSPELLEVHTGTSMPQKGLDTDNNLSGEPETIQVIHTIFFGSPVVIYEHLSLGRKKGLAKKVARHAISGSSLSSDIQSTQAEKWQDLTDCKLTPVSQSNVKGLC